MARASAPTALSEAFEDWAAADAAATRNESRRTRGRVISCLPAPKARASHRLYRAEREQESTGRDIYRRAASASSTHAGSGFSVSITVLGRVIVSKPERTSK